MRKNNTWVRKKAPEKTWFVPDHPPIFQPGDNVHVEKYGERVFTVERVFPEPGYRGRLYDLKAGGVKYLEYEHEMKLVNSPC